MSEIINNRQQRVEIMKNLIRQLHNGVAEEQVKHQLETMLDEADYSDVFLMEVQLVQEGIPAQKIQELCDTHTRVLKRHLDLSETPETVAGHPVNTAPMFRSVAFKEALGAMGVELVLRTDARAWHDFRDLDLHLAVRDLPEPMIRTKPATKLVHSWLTACPGLLGPEPSYRLWGTEGTDYFEVRTPEG